MKQGIHPEQYDINLTCTTCGALYQIRSTASELKTTLCSACHPFFSGEQKFVDTAGRIERFENKYKKFKK